MQRKCITAMINHLKIGLLDEIKAFCLFIYIYRYAIVKKKQYDLNVLKSISVLFGENKIHLILDRKILEYYF